MCDTDTLMPPIKPQINLSSAQTLLISSMLTNNRQAVNTVSSTKTDQESIKSLISRTDNVLGFDKTLFIPGIDIKVTCRYLVCTKVQRQRLFNLLLYLKICCT